MCTTRAKLRFYLWIYHFINEFIQINWSDYEKKFRINCYLEQLKKLRT